uniref:KH domain-containing protein n=1 Tax=Caenorhabditis tropicalis TaxID=1561998 RepID=A0A1I7U0A3_9PELO
MCANGPVATMSLQIKVPRVTVGAIMGLQGKNIKRLSDETGTKIQFMSDDDPKLMERTLSIIGHKSKVQVAAQLIRAIVETNNESSHAPVSLFYLSIPSSKCGLVIGRGGETIKQINIESGAHCELTREGNEDPNEKTFVIRGTDYQVEHAKHLIGIKVGDIPPNTPFAYANQLQHPMPTQYPMQSQPQMQQQNPMQQAYQQQQMQQKQQPTNVQMWAGQPIIQQAPLQPPHQTQQQQSLINPAYPGPTYPPQPNFAAQQNFAPTGNFQAQQVIQPSSIAAWHQLQQQKQMMQQQQLQQQQIQQQQLQQHQMQQQQLQQQQLLQLQGQQQYGRFDQSSLLTLAGPQLLPQAHQMVQQPQTQSAVHAAAAPAQSPVKSPAAPAEQGLSLYAQYALQVAAESKAQKEAAEKAAASQKAAAAPKATENQSEAKEEGAQDFSEQWYQYYISIGDHGAAEAVRKRIEQLKAEKEKKNAASSSRNGEF